MAIQLNPGQIQNAEHLPLLPQQHVVHQQPPQQAGLFTQIIQHQIWTTCRSGLCAGAPWPALPWTVVNHYSKSPLTYSAGMLFSLGAALITAAAVTDNHDNGLLVAIGLIACSISSCMCLLACCHENGTCDACTQRCCNV